MHTAALVLAAAAPASLPAVSARLASEQQASFKAIQDGIRQACQGSTLDASACPNAASGIVFSILSSSALCAQQDAADGFIDLANKGVTDTAKKARFIQFRAHERNSVPNPCSPICDRPPKNKQLLGIIQAQDPACKAIPALPAAQAQAIAANPAQVKANLAAVGQKAVNSGHSSAGSEAGDTSDNTTDSTASHDDSTGDDDQDSEDQSGTDGSGSNDNDSGNDDSGSDDGTGSAAVAFKAGDLQCIDDTRFKHFTSETAFVEGRCPAGLCFTRSPPLKNSCIGKEAAQRIDGMNGAGGSGTEPGTLTTAHGRRRGRARPTPTTKASTAPQSTLGA
ncbi:hypothetical protein HK105_203227 [Polyrhizophydium stewartii]|uniref:Uncharacterized protein n=1 Tax=Polyrhizophydium stewartii TaxID=2732419 RepID=A0ABR4NCD7_9FUNG